MVVTAGGATAMDSRRQAIPILIAAVYAALVVFPCLVILAANHVPNLVVALCLYAYALPLFLTVQLDFWLLGGVGFWSWIVFALFVFMTTISVWPLPVLAIAPSLWKSPRLKRAIAAYAVGFVILFILAALWMSRRGVQILFG